MARGNVMNELALPHEFILAILWAFDSFCLGLVFSPQLLIAGPLSLERWTTAQRQMICLLHSTTTRVPGQLAHTSENLFFLVQGCFIRCLCVWSKYLRRAGEHKHREVTLTFYIRGNWKGENSIIMWENQHLASIVLSSLSDFKISQHKNRNGL